MSTFHVFLAEANSVLRIARRYVVLATARIAVTRLTTVCTEVVVVRLASVTLVARYARLTLTTALRVALQGTGANGVAVARDTVAILAQEEVFFAAFAVGSVSVGGTIDTVTTVTGEIVQGSVEVALVGESVAVASWNKMKNKFLKENGKGCFGKDNF